VARESIISQNMRKNFSQVEEFLADFAE